MVVRLPSGTSGDGQAADRRPDVSLAWASNLEPACQDRLRAVERLVAHQRFEVAAP